MRKAISMFVGAVAAALLLAACGGDDDGGDVESLPSDEFVEQADALCQENDEAIAEEFSTLLEDNPELAEASGPQDVPDDLVEEIVDLGVGHYENLIDELETIAPEGDEDAWSNVLGDLEDALNAIQDEPRAFFDETGDDPFAEATEGAEALGLQVCGS